MTQWADYLLRGHEDPSLGIQGPCEHVDPLQVPGTQH